VSIGWSNTVVDGLTNDSYMQTAITSGYATPVITNCSFRNKTAAAIIGDNVTMSCDRVCFCKNAVDVQSKTTATRITLADCMFSSPVAGATLAGPAGTILYNVWYQDPNCAGGF
jgi:hypothetical protein